MSESLSEVCGPDGLPDDAALINAVRRGDIAAYGLLYERHLAVARRVAATYGATMTERDDLVAESFTKVLQAIRAGHGPTEKFRSYLLTAVRNALINQRRQDSALVLVADLSDTAGPDAQQTPLDVRIQAELAADAFARLPERWREVLWHTEVEGRRPAQVAPLLGLTPNATAALAYRARCGLRAEYLNQYLPTVAQRGCRVAVEQLAGWVRQTLSPRKMRATTAHLDHCGSCRELAAELRQLNEELPTPPRSPRRAPTAAPPAPSVPRDLATLSPALSPA